MKRLRFISIKCINIFFASFVLIALYVSKCYNYLLFHGLTELYSIAIAMSLFMITWNARHFLKNNYLLFLGIAYFFVGSLDLFHTLAYKGMNIFPGYGSNLATQLWISARFVESLSFLIAPLLFNYKFKVNFIFYIYFGIFTIILVTTFSGIFPDCYVEGTGLTPFKKICEYIICLIFTTSILILSKKKEMFDEHVLKLLGASIMVTIFSELALTLYISVYGFFNWLGHLLKLVSFFLIYKAIIETGLRKPYNLLFKDLKQSQENLIIERNKAQKYLDIAGVMVVVINVEQQVTLINKKGCELFGYNEEEIIGKNWFDVFVPDEYRNEAKANFSNLISGEIKSVEYTEYPVTTKDSRRRFISWHHTVITNIDQSIVETLSSGEDITERRKAEEQIKKDAETKSILLKEISHRVKNNLSSIIGLLYTEKKHLSLKQNLNYKNIMDDLINRITGISIVHNLLTITEWRPLLITDLIKQISDNVLKTAGTSKQIVINILPSSIKVTARQSHNIALIINELATNSIKYFTDEQKYCNINIHVQQNTNDELSIDFRDNGPGYPLEVLQQQKYNVGLYLIENIVNKELGGEVIFKNENGAVAIIKFKKAN